MKNKNFKRLCTQFYIEKLKQIKILNPMKTYKLFNNYKGNI